MRREKKSAAVFLLSPSAGLALPSIHRRPFAPRGRGSRFQPWGLERPKGRHRPARLCRGSPEAASYLRCRGPGAAGARAGAADQHRGTGALGRSLYRAGRAPRCLLELLIPGVRSFSGLSAAGAHPHAASSGELVRLRPAQHLREHRERGPAAAPIYGRAVRGEGAGRDLIGPGAGSGGPGPVPVPFPGRGPPCGGQSDAQPAPTLRGRSSPEEPRTTGRTGVQPPGS